MTAEQVLIVVDELVRAGCWVSVEGGWGVDALVGRATRSHRDLDIGLDARNEATALAVLESLGYRVEADWRPTRVELAAPGGGRVDVHPLAVDSEGNARQSGLNGESYLYPAASFVTGRILDRPVTCLSAAQQLEWHHGYDLRESDRADLSFLRKLTAREKRPAIPSPPVNRHVLATRDQLLAVRRELRTLAEQHGLSCPRLTALGTVLVGIPDKSDDGPLTRFAADAASSVQAWVNVVADHTPWAPTDTAAIPL